MTPRTALVQERPMVQPHSGPNREQVVDAMIDLTRLTVETARPFDGAPGQNVALCQVAVTCNAGSLG
jgi:hypothetical protein